MTRYAKKPDTNHGEIRDALRAIPGMRVLDTAAMSGLGCDLMALSLIHISEPTRPY